VHGYGEDGHALIRHIAGVVLRADVDGRGHPDGVRAAVGVAVIDRGAVGAGDGLVHHAVAVPVDGVGEDGAAGSPLLAPSVNVSVWLRRPAYGP